MLVQAPDSGVRMGDWQLELILHPKRKITSNCQAPVVCLSVSMYLHPRSSRLGDNFFIFVRSCFQKVRREPGSKRQQINRTSKDRETIGMDSGGPELPFDMLVELFRSSLSFGRGGLPHLFCARNGSDMILLEHFGPF